MKLMVFDVGGTEIKYSVIGEEQSVCVGLEISNAGSVPTPEGSQEEFFDMLERIYRPFAEETEGIALSLPGFIDIKEGKCLGGGALIYNRQQEIAAPLAERCGCPVHMANDAKCAALAELRMGALQGCTNACTFVIGTGVGGGLILNGEVFNGKHYTGGELSYLHCCADDWDNEDSQLGIRCSSRFGLLGLYHRYYRRYHECLGEAEKEAGSVKAAGAAAQAAESVGVAEESGEAAAADWCSFDRSRKDKEPGLTAEDEGEARNGLDFFRLYHENDPIAVRALKDFCMETAKQIYNLGILLDLERCAIGGGISRQDALISGIRESLEDLYSRGDTESREGIARTEVVRCRFGNEANQVGAFLYFKQALS